MDLLLLCKRRKDEGKYANFYLICYPFLIFKHVLIFCLFRLISDDAWRPGGHRPVNCLETTSEGRRGSGQKKREIHQISHRGRRQASHKGRFLQLLQLSRRYRCDRLHTYSNCMPWWTACSVLYEQEEPILHQHPGGVQPRGRDHKYCGKMGGKFP